MVIKNSPVPVSSPNIDVAGKVEIVIVFLEAKLFEKGHLHFVSSDYTSRRPGRGVYLPRCRTGADHATVCHSQALFDYGCILSLTLSAEVLDL